jgi:hypothetical protein
MSFIYLLIFTKSLWLHVKHFIALTKRESVRIFFFVITDQDYPCQHIDQWPRKTREIHHKKSWSFILADICYFIQWNNISLFLDIGRRFGLVWVMGFNTTFNNISVISWQSLLLVEETRVPKENHRPAARD